MREREQPARTLSPAGRLRRPWRHARHQTHPGIRPRGSTCRGAAPVRSSRSLASGTAGRSAARPGSCGTMPAMLMGWLCVLALSPILIPLPAVVWTATRRAIGRLRRQHRHASLGLPMRRLARPVTLLVLLLSVGCSHSTPADEPTQPVPTPAPDRDAILKAITEAVVRQQLIRECFGTTQPATSPAP